jgi:hypothetical protein
VLIISERGLPLEVPLWGKRGTGMQKRGPHEKILADRRQSGVLLSGFVVRQYQVLLSHGTGVLLI